MKKQRFGIEVEFTGITRATAIKEVAKVIGGYTTYDGGTYNSYSARSEDGRKWKVVSDASVQPEDSRGGYAGNEYKCELVSPICTYEDIETVQEIIRAIRRAGARVNDSCGIHIHIDASEHTARSLRNIANIMASKETLLFKALEVREERANRWCKKVDNSLLNILSKSQPKTLAEVKRIWYKGIDGSHQHYHESRYHALNLHSVWQKGTVELRMFNSTLHAGKIKAYIQLALAISNQAKVQKCASSKETVSTNPKFTFRTWLIRLGLNGAEFKTARLHLLANLEGDIAWRDNRRMVA